MCGRYIISSNKKIYEKFGYLIKSNYNVSPSNSVLVLDKTLKIKEMQWNYYPIWAQNNFRLINARCESLKVKPSFRGTSRCIFISDGYYEWQRLKGKKIPYFHFVQNKLIYFGGIYNQTSGCCIVTRKSYGNISHIHHRQPIILKEEEFDSWINLTHDYSSPITKEILFYKVSNRVNSPINNSIENIKNIESN